MHWLTPIKSNAVAREPKLSPQRLRHQKQRYESFSISSSWGYSKRSQSYIVLGVFSGSGVTRTTVRLVFANVCALTIFFLPRGSGCVVGAVAVVVPRGGFEGNIADSLSLARRATIPHAKINPACRSRFSCLRRALIRKMPSAKVLAQRRRTCTIVCKCL